MSILGITGSFGTGKTTVARFFKELGAVVIDADKIARQLIKANTPICRRIILNFGNNILKNNCLNIDRAKLSRIVFRDKKSLKKLNRLIHPVIIREIKKEIRLIKNNNPAKIIILDAPLLLEAGVLNLVDKLVVVMANRKTQLFRIKKQKHLTKLEINSRIKAQLPLRKKIKSADYLIDNNGSLRYTRNQVRKIWEGIKIR